MNADIVGYSALVADDLEVATDIMREYHELVGSQVAENGGTLANFVGDSFMAVFDDPFAALRSAIGITTKVEARNVDLPPARQARFRMGLDQGEVTEATSGFHGDALNIAARIQSIAPAGGLAVSGRVYQSLDEPALRFHTMGRHTLKNIPEGVDVYEYVDLPSDGSRGRDFSLALETPIVAVLPVIASTATAEVKASSEMFRGDLLHRLSRVPELAVIDADDPDHPPATARYMLEVGVHQSGDTVRLFTTLVEVRTLNIVKSHRRTVAAADVLSVSEELADQIARSIEVDLIVGAPADLYEELNDPVSIEKVYQGWYHLRLETPEAWIRAVQLFDEVATSHPDIPYGYALKAYALYMGASKGELPDPDGAILEARELARIAQEKNDPTGLAETIEAAVLLKLGHTEESRKLLDTVVKLRPT